MSVAGRIGAVNGKATWTGNGTARALSGCGVQIATIEAAAVKLPAEPAGSLAGRRVISEGITGIGSGIAAPGARIATIETAVPPAEPAARLPAPFDIVTGGAHCTGNSIARTLTRWGVQIAAIATAAILTPANLAALPGGTR